MLISWRAQKYPEFGRWTLDSGQIVTARFSPVAKRNRVNPQKPTLLETWTLIPWSDKKSDPYLTGFDKTAWEKDAYAFVIRGGRTDFNTVEDWLHDKEEDAKSVLRKLRAQQMISNSEK